MLKKIISGGQTGADQGALDGARKMGFLYGGFLPAGRKTEAGPLPSEYLMDELDSSDYPARTAANVENSDATLIISYGVLSGGSALTLRLARGRSKPFLHLDLEKQDEKQGLEEAAAWIREHRIETLNVAGPRASSDCRIYQSTRQLVAALIRACRGEKA